MPDGNRAERVSKPPAGQPGRAAVSSAPPSACLDEDSLLALVEGRLGAVERRNADRHVDECEECRILVAALARGAESVDQPLDPSRAPPPRLPGRLGERFVLQREVGSGRHGRVFAARDTTRDESVALKWIRPELAAKPGVAHAICDVALAVRSIDYPNIARVHAVHIEGSTLVIVGELTEGETLDKLLAAGPPSPSVALDVVAQLVAAMAAAHRHGLVHGDLKPANVILDLAGHVSITDFGLAAAMSGSPPNPTPAAKLHDTVTLALLALDLLTASGREQGELRQVCRRCIEGAEELGSAVELEAALRRAFDEQRGHDDADEQSPRSRWIPAPGELVGGRYRVEGIIGSGGMSIVLAAKQLDLDRRVAVKLMPPRAARRRSAVERFLREARAASAIESEHVARIFDVGRCENGTPYMAMEYLVGVTLGRLLRKNGPLPIEDVLSYVLQASVTVAECHARGIVHRDLKPDNIMVLDRPGQQGFVKVLDFGISKTDWVDSRSDSNLTATTDMLGTPTYMSPEQVRSSKGVDARTDIWAFGVMMYELSTGRTPFLGDNIPAVAASIVSDQPTPPRALRPELPAALEQVILRCLQKDPAARPASVRELAELLAPFAPPASVASLARIRQISRESVRPPPSAATHSAPSNPAPSNPVAAPSSFATPIPPPPALPRHASPVPPAPALRQPTPVPPAPTLPRPPTPVPPGPLPGAELSTTWMRYLDRRSASQRWRIALAASAVALSVALLSWLLSDETEEPDVIPIPGSAHAGVSSAPSTAPTETAKPKDPRTSPQPATDPRARPVGPRTGPLEGRF